MPDNESVKHELHLLEALNGAPETTQATLAAQVGVAVGTVNWYLKRWSAKGYVKIKRIDRWRWRYLLTPQGIAHKAMLARKYVDASMKLYRATRDEARRLLVQVQARGFDEVVIHGEGEIADVCRLTCLELGLKTSLCLAGYEAHSASVPVLVINGTELHMIAPRVAPDEQIEV